MKNAISLFSSAGIGDLGLKKNNIDTVISNELLSDRVKLFKENYPQAQVFEGDIWEHTQNIINYYKNSFTDAPFVVLATPPCQGMSSNGMGKMLSDHRRGLRPKLDERNRLIIPTIEVIKALKPTWVIFENVANMKNTVIEDQDGNLVNILDYIYIHLPEYVGKAEVINVADYGVPQNRKRLITILTNTESGKQYFNKHKTFLPPKTHSKDANLLTDQWITLRDSIGDFPALDGKKNKNKKTDFNIFHRVPILDEKKYFWIKHTPEGQTAFNNQCINPTCLYKNNLNHGAKMTNGINQAKKDTPLFCEKCGELLPRPYVIDKNTGEKRLMKGYTSAYKRMYWDEPASTLTQNFQFVSSDNKVHPTQNRVLSLFEAMELQSINLFDYKFKINDSIVKDSLIRDIIGESVPPLIIDLIIKNIKDIT